MKRYSLATDFESISKYFGDKNAVVISTLHGVKSEEYTTVIAAGLKCCKNGKAQTSLLLSRVPGLKN